MSEIDGSVVFIEIPCDVGNVNWNGILGNFVAELIAFDSWDDVWAEPHGVATCAIENA
jgi:hypothetical protein